MSKKDRNSTGLDTDFDLLPFKRLIADRCGLNFKDDFYSRLPDALEMRMHHRRIHNRSRYLDVLMNDELEFQSLVSHLTINETYFMRESHHYALLVDRLVPELLDKQKTIRILSAGCSTGEEPYSIIIALIIKFGADILNRVTITAIDIHPGAIQKAKRGIYGPNSFRDFDPAIKEKYFTPVGDNEFELLPFLKKAVKFQIANLGSNLSPDHFGYMDIIFYRNVAIYFQPDSQKAVFSRLTNLLSDEGYLFTSSVETCLHNVGILFLVEMDGIYLYSKRFEVKIDYLNQRAVDSPRARIKPLAKSAGHTQRPPAKKEKSAAELFDEALALTKRQEFESSLGILESILKRDHSHAKANTLKAAILVNLKKLSEAEGVCLKTLDIDEWNIECYLLLGIIANLNMDTKEAFRRFKGALYIQPDCWLAHFYLGELYYSLDQLDESYREYGVTLRLLQKNGVTNNGISFYPLSFSVEQLIHLCKHNLVNLKSRLH